MDAACSALEAANKKSAKFKTHWKKLKRLKKDARLIEELKGMWLIFKITS